MVDYASRHGTAHDDDNFHPKKTVLKGSDIKFLPDLQTSSVCTASIMAGSIVGLENEKRKLSPHIFMAERTGQSYFLWLNVGPP